MGDDVILFATADWDSLYWTNKQHTAAHLAAMGWRVLYVESPGLRTPTPNRADLGRIARRVWRGLLPARRTREGLWVLSPLGIPFGHRFAPIRRLNQGWLRNRLRIFLRQRGFAKPVIWTYHPLMLEAIRGLTRGPLVYHCVDDLTAIPGVDGPHIALKEEELLRMADVVFTTNTDLQARCARISANAHYYPNVVDFDHFARAHEPGMVPDDLAQIPRPRIGYVGVLSDFKVDLELLLEAARARPDWHWVLIGGEREGQQSSTIKAMRHLANIHLLGHRPYEALPDYLRGIDVGLILSRLNPYTRAMCPMKYFEYVAAGLPVVSTPLEFAKSQTHCRVATDVSDLINLIAQALNAGRLSSTESRAAVSDNTWESRLQKMLDTIARTA